MFNGATVQPSVAAAMNTSFITRWSTTRMNMHEGAQLLAAIPNGPWSAEDQRGLMDAVGQGIIRASVAGAGGGPKGQTMMSFEGWFNSGLKDSLEGIGSERMRLNHGAAFLWSIGATGLTETSLAAVLATMWLVMDKKSAQNMTGMQKLLALNDFKACVKRIVKQKRHRARTAVYSLTPQQWQAHQPALHAEVYGNDPPLAAFLPAVEVMTAVNAWPARKTSALVTCGAPSQAISVPETNKGRHF